MSGENVVWRWCGQCGSARWEGDGQPPNPNSITEPELPEGLRARVSSQQDDERKEREGVAEELDGLALGVFEWDESPMQDPNTSEMLRRAASLLRSSLQPSQPATECVFCRKPITEAEQDEEHPAPTCQLNDGRWVCSRDCWERAARMWDEPAQPSQV